jgi:molybdopterin synthase catalytic subunit
MSHPTIYSLTEDEVDINALLEQITWTSTGTATFTGMARGMTTRGDAHETEYLEYESYWIV